MKPVTRGVTHTPINIKQAVFPGKLNVNIWLISWTLYSYNSSGVNLNEVWKLHNTFLAFCNIYSLYKYVSIFWNKGAYLSEFLLTQRDTGETQEDGNLLYTQKDENRWFFLGKKCVFPSILTYSSKVNWENCKTLRAVINGSLIQFEHRQITNFGYLGQEPSNSHAFHEMEANMLLMFYMAALNAFRFKKLCRSRLE